MDDSLHVGQTPNYTDGPCYACAKEKLEEWVFERYENCQRIAKLKTGADQKGWLEDADNFMLILTFMRAPTGQWVKTSERLPDQGKPCIVIIGGIVQHATAKYYGDEGWEWVGNDWADNAPKDIVTHWKPLDAPPVD